MFKIKTKKRYGSISSSKVEQSVIEKKIEKINELFDDTVHLFTVKEIYYKKEIKRLTKMVYDDNSDKKKLKYDISIVCILFFIIIISGILTYIF